MRYCFAILSMVCLASVVNASTHSAGPRRSTQISPRQFVDYMLRHGDDATINAGRDAQMFGLPVQENSFPIKGDSTDPGELGPMRKSSCEIVLRDAKGKKHPVCMLVIVDNVDLKKHRNEGFEYKFDLEGRLEKALAVKGDVDDSGAGLPGGDLAELNAKDPSVIRQAQNELEYWLKRTAKKTAPAKKLNGSSKE